MYSLFDADPFQSVNLLFKRKYNISNERYQIRRAKQFLTIHKEPSAKSVFVPSNQYENRITFIKPHLHYIHS